MKNTMVLLVDEYDRQQSEPEQSMSSVQHAYSCNKIDLSQQQIQEMMQIIEEIRLKGYKDTL
ncbi:hypothetical protein P4604_14490 [Lysinibacillus capsici]|uniref:hypothetical protein n=1 Tax=Lysinibacillus capsici TaxID=2115968 RepID=UPI002E1C0F1F|nr:hypothetical protein [Lysinibacillus capsici]